jgi:hypothetical protein
MQSTEKDEQKILEFIESVSNKIVLKKKQITEIKDLIANNTELLISNNSVYKKYQKEGLL